MAMMVAGSSGDAWRRVVPVAPAAGLVFLGSILADWVVITLCLASIFFFGVVIQLLLVLTCVLNFDNAGRCA